MNPRSLATSPEGCWTFIAAIEVDLGSRTEHDSLHRQGRGGGHCQGTGSAACGSRERCAPSSRSRSVALSSIRRLDDRPANCPGRTYVIGGSPSHDRQTSETVEIGANQPGGAPRTIRFCKEATSIGQMRKKLDPHQLLLDLARNGGPDVVHLPYTPEFEAVCQQINPVATIEDKHRIWEKLLGLREGNASPAYPIQSCYRPSARTSSRAGEPGRTHLSWAATERPTLRYSRANS